ncbi:MAG: helix-turn-helix domain-containing protein [Rhodospirillaceae bacterium]
MAYGLKIADHLGVDDFRVWARRCGNGQTGARAYGLANALDGLDRAKAARLAGLERQALRDAVVRYNVENVAGLFDHPKGRRPEGLTESEQATVAAVIFRGPNPEIDGVCTWTREALAVWISRKFGKTVHPSSLTRPATPTAPKAGSDAGLTILLCSVP